MGWNFVKRTKRKSGIAELITGIIALIIGFAFLLPLIKLYFVEGLPNSPFVFSIPTWIYSIGLIVVGIYLIISGASKFWKK